MSGSDRFGSASHSNTWYPGPSDSGEPKTWVEKTTPDVLVGGGGAVVVGEEADGERRRQQTDAGRADVDPRRRVEHQLEEALGRLHEPGDGQSHGDAAGGGHHQDEVGSTHVEILAEPRCRNGGSDPYHFDPCPGAPSCLSRS